MKNLKFKRYNVGEVFEPTTAETNTIHLVPVSTEPLTVKAYDVDEYRNVAQISFDGWQENKDIILEEFEKYKLKYNDNANTLSGDIINRVDINTGENVNYRETTTWHDGSAMDDSKVDGKIYRKINDKYYFNTNRVNNKLFYIDDFNGVDDCEIFEKAIDFLKLIKGGTLKINREVNLKRNLHLTNVYNITIEGLRDSDSEVGENATIINLINNADSIIFEKFNKLKIKNLKILDLKGIKENVKTLELFNGYDYNISDVSIVSRTGINSRCISLGRGQGETCTFLGEIINISTYQPNGGVAIYSGATNTSLTFKKCYARGGSYTMDGTVYSSMINCATDGSKTNGYLFKGTGNSHLNSFSLISCGAEVAKFSAIKVESGVVGLSVIGGFHSGANKRIIDEIPNYDISKIGSLLTTETTDINHPIQSILIENPTIILPNGLDIYGGLYTGDVTIVSNFRFLGGVGGDKDFLKNHYTLISSKSEISDVTIKNKLVKKFDFCSIDKHLISANTDLSGTVSYLYSRINSAIIEQGFINDIVVSIPEGYTLVTEGLDTVVTLTNGLNRVNKKVTGQFAVVAQNSSPMSGQLKIGVDIDIYN